MTGVLNLVQVSRNPLGFFRERAAREGGIAHFRVLQHRVFLLTDPELIRDVLQTRAHLFHKSADYRSLRPVFGSGLLTSENPEWLAQRRRLQPAFQHARLDAYAPMMRECVARAFTSWQHGQTRNIHRDMMELTLAIVARTLLETSIPGRIDQVSRAVSAVFRDLSAAAMFIPLLRYLPTPRTVRWNRAVRHLDNVIRAVILEGRAALQTNAQSPPSSALLAMLLRARTADGEPLRDSQIRDELMTMFLAGHETTAVALSWTLYLLALHPEAAARLRRELDEANDSACPALPYLNAVIQESMRLYPPVWSIGREAKADLDLGGRLIPRGSQLWICHWIVHHDPAHFTNPDVFLPERWLSGETDIAARSSYLPFGAGARLCIGRAFAMQEAAIILAAILSRFELSLPPGVVVEAVPWFTLRPKAGLPMIVSARVQTPHSAAAN